MLVGDGASASVARPSGMAKSSAAAYGQMQRAPFRTPPQSLCLVVQVLDAWQRMLAVMPRNLEELSEWPSASFSAGDLAVVVSVSWQLWNVQDFPQMQHERSTQLVLFDSASRKRHHDSWRVDGHSRAPLTSQAGKVETAGKQQEHEALTRWLASSSTVGEGHA